MGILAGTPLWTDLDSAGVWGEIAETGQTFEHNAVLKATAYRDMSCLAILADDSGLVVNAVNDRPGVRSAGYAGEHATDQENLGKLLGEMREVPPGESDSALRMRGGRGPPRRGGLRPSPDRWRGR